MLLLLEKGFAIMREKSTPPFPYDEDTNKITLPADIQKEIRHLVATGNKARAVSRVTKLTGAGLRVSKDYVDALTKPGER
jgi:ribosomal protein L7/L12